MAVLKELRWQCDYCGNKSPVMENDHRYRNWIEQRVAGQTYGISSQLTVHFCCDEHYVSFMTESRI